MSRTQTSLVVAVDPGFELKLRGDMQYVREGSGGGRGVTGDTGSPRRQLTINLRLQT